MASPAGASLRPTRCDGRLASGCALPAAHPRVRPLCVSSESLRALQSIRSPRRAHHPRGVSSMTAPCQRVHKTGEYRYPLLL